MLSLLNNVILFLQQVALPRPAALQLVLLNGNRFILNAPKASSIHSFLHSFLQDFKTVSEVEISFKYFLRISLTCGQEKSEQRRSAKIIIFSENYFSFRYEHVSSDSLFQASTSQVLKKIL